MSKLDLNPLWQMFLMRMRSLWREPSALFWTFVFPLLTSVALGLAFRNTGPKDLTVAVVESPQAEAVAGALGKAPGLIARRASREDALTMLRTGKAALVVVTEGEPQFLVDPTQPDGRTARLMVEDALQRVRGRKDVLEIPATPVTAPGSRYIDFLIPGLLGMGLMMSGIWGLGWPVVQMRTDKLLKRLYATPMHRADFLLSFWMARAALSVLEVAFFVGYARVLFGVHVFGSLWQFFALALLGTFSFGAIALLVASRAQNMETANGLMNLATMPMMLLSGVFFSASNFPEWLQPLVRALPLTALLDGLRGIMTDGKSLAVLVPQLAVLGVWGLIPFAIALRIFRWT